MDILRFGRTVRCGTWGSNTFGTVGDGSGGTVVAPVKVMEHIAGAWVSGEEHSLRSLTSDGTLWTWGSNGSGELGYPDFDRTQNYGLWGTGVPYQSKPKAVSLTDVVQVTAGRPGITLALRSDGTLWAAGGEYGSAFVKVLDGVKIPNRDAQLSGPGMLGSLAAMKPHLRMCPPALGMPPMPMRRRKPV